MKTLSLLTLLFLLASCGMPQGGPVATNPPPNPSPTPGAAPQTPETPTETTPDANTPTFTTAEEIQVYVKAFETRNLLAGGGFNPTSLTVGLENMPINILGTCSMNSATVKLNSYYWSQLSPAHKEELVFHELGHCVLGRYHDDTLASNGFPLSIMNSYHMGPSVYIRSAAAYRDYQAELFHTTSYTFAAVSFNAQDYPVMQASSVSGASRTKQYSSLRPESISCEHP